MLIVSRGATTEISPANEVRWGCSAPGSEYARSASALPQAQCPTLIQHGMEFDTCKDNLTYQQLAPPPEYMSARCPPLIPYTRKKCDSGSFTTVIKKSCPLFNRIVPSTLSLSSSVFCFQWRK